MSGQILSIDLQVVVCVELPELAVDYVEMLVREVVCYSVDVILSLEWGKRLEEIAPPQFTGCDSTVPILVHNVEYSPNHLEANNTIKLPVIVILPLVFN